MRVVGGRFKGKPLAGPKSDAIRPTSDRTREAIFNILEHRFGDVIDGARVLDLCAGTGALGIEAISRGARSGLFIDMSAEARALVRGNLETMGVMGLARISKRDATHLGPAFNQGGFTLVFFDPPYGKGLSAKVLQSLARGNWMAPGGILVLEEKAGEEIALPEGFTEEDRRAYGETEIRFLRWQAGA